MATLARLTTIEHKLRATECEPEPVVCVLQRLTYADHLADIRDVRERLREQLRVAAAGGDTLPADGTDSAMDRAAEAQDYLRGFVGAHLVEVRGLTDWSASGHDSAKACVLDYRELLIELADVLRAKATLGDEGKKG